MMGGRWRQRLRITGVWLVALSGVAIFTFGMMRFNHDPGIAGPGTEDPRRLAAIALVVSVPVLFVGFALVALGRPAPTPAAASMSGSGSIGLLSSDTIVNQKTKLLGRAYRILDGGGNQIGTIREEAAPRSGYGLWGFARTERLILLDAAGHEVLVMDCPQVWDLRSVRVADASDEVVGRIVQLEHGAKRYAIEAVNGSPMGSIVRKHFLNDRSFSILDASGGEVGQISRKWGGLLRDGFSTTVLNISRPVSPQMRLMMLASPGGISLARYEPSSAT